ncbi:MAG: hypothetical protein ACRC6V_13315 [Bacteroidales bacterium]
MTLEEQLKLKYEKLRKQATHMGLSRSLYKYVGKDLWVFKTITMEGLPYPIYSRVENPGLVSQSLRKL